MTRSAPDDFAIRAKGIPFFGISHSATHPNRLVKEGKLPKSSKIYEKKTLGITPKILRIPRGRLRGTRKSPTNFGKMRPKLMRHAPQLSQAGKSSDPAEVCASRKHRKPDFGRVTRSFHEPRITENALRNNQRHFLRSESHFVDSSEKR